MFFWPKMAIQWGLFQKGLVAISSQWGQRDFPFLRRPTFVELAFLDFCFLADALFELRTGYDGEVPRLMVGARWCGAGSEQAGLNDFTRYGLAGELSDRFASAHVVVKVRGTLNHL